MQNLTIKAGTVDVSCVIRIVDSTDGTPETGVTSASGGLDLQYRRELATSTAITESDLTNLNDAHSDGGMKHIGNGYYRLDLPDAACAAGAAGVLVHGTVTGMVVVGAYINLTQVPADVTYISGDATAADNLEALFDGTGYEPVIGNGVNLSGVVAKGTLSGTHSATTADLGTSAPANDISGMTLYFPDDKLSRVIDSYNTGTGVATFSPSVAVTLTNGDNWVLYPSPAYSTGTVPNVNVAQVSGDATAADNLEAMLDGTGFVTLTADVSGNLSGSVGSVTGTVGGVAGTITTLDALDAAQDTQHAQTQTDVAAVQTTADAVEVDTQDIQSRIPAALVGGRIDATVDATGMEAGAVATILTTQMTESYAADGAAPTIAQALMMIQQMLGEFAVSGTTLTVKKVDGSTSAATYTLSDATDPTSITRAS